MLPFPDERPCLDDAFFVDDDRFRSRARVAYVFTWTGLNPWSMSIFSARSIDMVCRFFRFPVAVAVRRGGIPSGRILFFGFRQNSRFLDQGCQRTPK